MQHMPDKEFDNLFKDKFKDAEIEPSANLWANIERELEPERKRTFPIYWMAAATVAIAVTAILLMQKKEVKYMQGADSITAAKTTVIVDTTTNKIKVKSTDEQELRVAKATIGATKSQAKHEVEPKVSIIENTIQNDKVAVQPNTPVERLPIKQQDPKPIDVLPVKTSQIENPTVIAHATTNDKVETSIDEAGNSSERKGIRNVGDLVNYVVEKVDKRDKKLLRFNTDDDDNSSIIGINIGFLKFNKKNKEQR